MDLTAAHDLVRRIDALLCDPALVGDTTSIRCTVVAADETTVQLAHEVEDYDAAVAGDGFTGFSGTLFWNALLDQEPAGSHGYAVGDQLELTVRQVEGKVAVERFVDDDGDEQPDRVEHVGA